MKNGSPIAPTLLTIAGSDPSGGAGIQADLKTMTTIGVYGAAAITSLTVQNSRGVREIHPLPPEFVIRQVQAVLEDHRVTHIKIGMTGTARIAETLAELLKDYSGEVIFDPVFTASSGDSLLQETDIVTLLQPLLARVTFLTPNIGELEQLSNHTIANKGDALHAAALLLENLPNLKAVVVKGGHLKAEGGTIHDFLVRPATAIIESKRTRHRSVHLHGTGCTYGSALASFLALGLAPDAAFHHACNYMDRVIRAGLDERMVDSGGNGPLIHHRLCR